MYLFAIAVKRRQTGKMQEQERTKEKKIQEEPIEKEEIKEEKVKDRGVRKVIPIIPRKGKRSAGQSERKSAIRSAGGKKVYLSSSATLEAALVIPLYIYAVVAVLYLLLSVGIQMKVRQALYTDARKMGQIAYTADQLDTKNPILTEAAAKGILMKELGMDFGENHHIAGGTAGILLVQSEFLEHGNEISLCAEYVIRNPFDIFGLGIIHVKQTCVTCAWLGERTEEDLYQDDQQEEMVYITRSGEVYHRDKDCSYLKIDLEEVSGAEVTERRNEDGEKYYPCSSCCSGGVSAEERVYIASYGNRYHTNPACKTLLHFVQRVPLSAVQDRRPCSKCGNNGGKT